MNIFFPAFFTHNILKLGHTEFCLELFLVCFLRESRVRTFGCRVHLKSLIITVGGFLPQNPFCWWCWLKGCHLYVFFAVSLLCFPKLHNLNQQFVWNNPNPGFFFCVPVLCNKCGFFEMECFRVNLPFLIISIYFGFVHWASRLCCSCILKRNLNWAEIAAHKLCLELEWLLCLM